MALTDYLREIDCSGDADYDSDNMLILFNRFNNKIYQISFGDGSDDDPIEGCDQYLYISVKMFDECGDLTEVYGGNLWFRSGDYSGKLNDEKMVYDALSFVDCKYPDLCMPLVKM